jgi:2-polyprenyl-3-methyl-5-hydroxy-6-metoxy-1,4-benzoquinol methylase
MFDAERGHRGTLGGQVSSNTKLFSIILKVRQRTQDFCNRLSSHPSRFILFLIAAVIYLHTIHQMKAPEELSCVTDLPAATTTLRRGVPMNSTNGFRYLPADMLISEQKTEVRKVSEQYSGKYDVAWKSQYPRGSCFGCRFFGKLQNLIHFDTVLDGGAGNGMGVRMMRSLGKAAYGIELSEEVLKNDAQDLLSIGVVQVGTLTDIPYKADLFDLVTSSDVLEHIEVGMEDSVVSEIVRVAKRYIVLSISLKSHQNENVHTYLRRREYWEDLFAKHGAVVHSPLKKVLQETTHDVYPPIVRSTLTDCRMEGNPTQGGLYECCLVKNHWLVGLDIPRDIRAVTTENGELEPWMFAFEKVKNRC